MPAKGTRLQANLATDIEERDGIAAREMFPGMPEEDRWRVDELARGGLDLVLGPAGDGSP